MIVSHGLLPGMPIVDVDLDGCADLIVPPNAPGLLAVVRDGGRPVGTFTVSGPGRYVRADHVHEAARRVTRHHRRWRRAGDGLVVPARSLPSVTVAVCTRDRPEGLARLLASLGKLDVAGLDVEIVVVDNAPTDGRTADAVRAHAGVRYVREDRPGLDWARNRALLEAANDVVAFTDDDVEVEPEWVRAIAIAFAEDPSVLCVTGLVLPATLETRAQILFERYGGFGRGYRRRWYRADVTRSRSVLETCPGPGEFGTGANMAVRRSAVDQVGLFDPALDVGTVTGGGGDLEYFLRVLLAGGTLLYEPAAVVRHHHRSELDGLARQFHGHGHGLAAVLAKTWRQHPDERAAILELLKWWTAWMTKRVGAAAGRTHGFPLGLIGREIGGLATGWKSYAQALADARAIEAGHGPTDPEWPLDRILEPPVLPPSPAPADARPIAIDDVDLDLPLPTLAPVSSTVRTVRLRRGGHHVAEVELRAAGGEVSPRRLADAAADRLAALTPWPPAPPPQLGDRETWPASVSVLIASRNRPEALARCLERVRRTRTERSMQVIVVDNDPASGATRSLRERHTWVEWVDEPRPGLSVARNAGMPLVRGDVVVTLDDDVTVEPGWLDELLRPFADPRVAAVTANVLPASLEGAAPRRFEQYGGLGRGDVSRFFDRWWLHDRRVAATWEVGATACAAFVTSVLCEERIGAWEESLGAGTPAGVGEDTLVFHRILETDRAIVYHAGAAVTHHHRATMTDLEAQLSAYSAGHVAFLLTTALVDRDPRSLRRIVSDLPRHHARMLVRASLGRGQWPASLTLVEARGNLAGPVAFLRSRWRAARNRR